MISFAEGLVRNGWVGAGNRGRIALRCRLKNDGERSPQPCRTVGS